MEQQRNYQVLVEGNGEHFLVGCGQFQICGTQNSGEHQQQFPLFPSSRDFPRTETTGPYNGNAKSNQPAKSIRA